MGWFFLGSWGTEWDGVLLRGEEHRWGVFLGGGGTEWDGMLLWRGENQWDGGAVMARQRDGVFVWGGGTAVG